MEKFAPGQEAYMRIGEISFHGEIICVSEKKGGRIRYDFKVNGTDFTAYGVDASHIAAANT
jgi:hypothetical protein